MATPVNAKSNTGCSHSGWIIRPLDLSIFGGQNFSAIERKILSALYTFSGKDFCRFTYSELQARYRCSLSSVYRTIRKAIRGNFKRGKKKCQYAFGEERDPGQLFLKIEEWLYFAAFSIGDEYDFLTNNEVEVLSLLRYYAGKRWSTSQNRVADELGISSSTASLAFSRLSRMDLIEAVSATGEAQQRTANHHIKTFYRINEKLLAQKKSEIIKHVKGKSASVKAIDERTDRERYYARVQQMESDRIERLETRLGKEFSELKRQLGILGMEYAKAELSAQREKLREIQKRRQEIQAAMRKKLEDLGLTEHDLEPHFLCRECRDTGIRSDGSLCTCWKERRS